MIWEPEVATSGPREEVRLVITVRSDWTRHEAVQQLDLTRWFKRQGDHGLVSLPELAQELPRAAVEPWMTGSQVVEVNYRPTAGEGYAVEIELRRPPQTSAGLHPKRQARLTDDIPELLRKLFAWDRARVQAGDRQGQFNSESAAGILGWTPERLNRTVTVLERRGLLEVDESGGSHPFVTHGFELSEEGFLECERLGLDRDPSSEEDEPMSSGGTPDAKKVFIIHGRNVEARAAVEHFLKALKLEPIDFDELAADMGTEFVGNIVVEGVRRAQGVVALFTPDEFAALLPAFRKTHDKPSDIMRWQARPNVIFEAGIAFGIARERSALVTLGGEVSLFSDVEGIHLLRLNNHVESRGKFRQKLIGMRCDLDTRTNAWTDPTKSGDFEACLAPLSGVSPRDPFP